MSNNKPSMKLYTEADIAKAVMFGRWGGTMKKDYQEFLNKLTTIELPSDEEIIKQGNLISDLWEQTIYMSGAKWMRDKIQGGNNEQQ